MFYEFQEPHRPFTSDENSQLYTASYTVTGRTEDGQASAVCDFYGETHLKIVHVILAKCFSNFSP